MKSVHEKISNYWASLKMLWIEIIFKMSKKSKISLQINNPQFPRQLSERLEWCFPQPLGEGVFEIMPWVVPLRSRCRRRSSSWTRSLSSCLTRWRAWWWGWASTAAAWAWRRALALTLAFALSWAGAWGRAATTAAGARGWSFALAGTGAARTRWRRWGVALLLTLALFLALAWTDK